MKTFKLVAAQGEITFKRIGDVPADKSLRDGYSPLVAEKGHFIIGHSETGHHHVVKETGVSVCVMDRPPEGMRILRMIVESPTPIVHLREHHTHEDVMLGTGEYEARIAREYDPFQELARQVAD